MELVFQKCCLFFLQHARTFWSCARSSITIYVCSIQFNITSLLRLEILQEQGKVENLYLGEHTLHLFHISNFIWKCFLPLSCYCKIIFPSFYEKKKLLEIRKTMGEKCRYYEGEQMPKIRHFKAGLISMVNCGNNMWVFMASCSVSPQLRVC